MRTVLSFPSLGLALLATLPVMGAGPPASAESTKVRTGSGFAISRDTHVVTNAHVVARCKSIRALFGTQGAPARVLALNERDDLALLQTTLALPRTLALRGSPALRLGDSVVAFGFPMPDALSQEGNLTTGNVSALAGAGDDPKYVQITAPVQPGNSGGPLLDLSGNLVGVITAKLDAMAVAKRTGDIPQNVNFAVRGEVLESFLRSANVGYEKAASDRALPVADVADIAKAAAVRLECSGSDGLTAGVTPAPVAPRVEAPVKPSTPPPAVETPKGPPPAAAAGDREELVKQIQITEVRTPYPETAPALRSVTIVNDGWASIYRVTVGWLESKTARQCPASPSAYDGQKELFVSLPPGQKGTTMGEFPPQAKLFCVIDVAATPAARRPEPARETSR